MKRLTEITGKKAGSRKRSDARNKSRGNDLPSRFAQITCAFLITCILTVSAPAAPLVIKTSLSETYQDARFNLLSGSFGANLSGWATSLLLFLPTKKQTQSINKIEILPGEDVNIRQGEPVNFSAIAYSTENNPVSGLKFKWTVQDVGRNQQARNLPSGTFPARAAGSFVITAEAEGLRKQIDVTVQGNPALMMLKKLKAEEASGNFTNVNKLKQQKKYTTEVISSKKDYKDKNKDDGNQDKNKTDAPEAAYYPPTDSTREKLRGPNAGAGDADAEYENSIAAAAKGTSASAATARRMMRPIDEQGWGDNNWWTADDPGNEIGAPPGTSPDAGAGNGNFQFSAPVVALPGRGIDLNLSLNYNSRLWDKSGNKMSYDSDRGFPAPGWSLGFGKMMFMGTSGGCMINDADGTRHGYNGSTSNYTYGSSVSSSFNGHSADGSFIDYNCYYSSNQYGKGLSGSAKLPNGTTIYYNSSTANGEQAFPTQITDAQGNYISITYRNNRGPEIQTVTDTMGRVVTFNYDSNNRLISVSVPKMDNAGTRIAVQLHYQQIALNPGFAYPLTTDAANWTPAAIDAIYYPGTGTGYWFGDGDSYSSYGMIAKVLEQRAMSWSAGPYEQGTVTAGQMSKQAVYNYPLQPNYALTDAPTYGTLTESWAGMDDAPAVTSYDIYNNSNPRTITVTQPNGVKSKQTSYNASGQWYDGLIYQDETLDGSNQQLSKSVVTWEQGSYDSPRPNHTEITDERGQVLKTDLTYGANYNQLVSQKEYDYDGATLLRDTRTIFENSSSYVNNHVFNLVKTTEIFDRLNNRVARTDYEYDNNAVANGTQNHNMTATPGVTMHYGTYDPYTTDTQDGSNCTQYETMWVPGGDPYDPNGSGYNETYCVAYEQVSAYNANTIFRGNITKTTGYADAANLAGAISQTKQYDDTGNLVAESASCCQLKTYFYDDPNTTQIDTQYAYPVKQTRGSSDPNSSIRNTVSTVYDFNTGLVKQSTDPNGRISTNQYNADNLRPTISTSPTGAYSQTTYDEAAMTVTSETHQAGGALAGQTVSYLNGVGQAVKQKTLGKNGVFDFAEAKYNNLGQLWKQSNPYRAGDTLQWTETAYDLLGRTKTVTSPDGSVTKAFYNEAARPDSATNQPGSTTRVVDAWGRERWGRYDARQKLAEVVEPNPNGNGLVSAAGSLLTKYSYDTLGSLTETEQGVQHRKFKYDSLGRLTMQKLAEQTATLNDAGQYVGAGSSAAQWSEAYLYDERNLFLKTDARGIKTHFVYWDINAGTEDPLNRLRQVYYDLSGPRDTSVNIPGAFDITYDYMTTGDQDRIKKVESTGLAKEEYAYDNEGRVQDYTQTVLYRESYPMTVSYLYDSLDRTTDVRYPAQYGLTGSPRKVVQQTYDAAGSLSTLKYDGSQQAGDAVFNAAGQTTSINIGTPGANQVNENYTFDQQTGLLTNQKVQRGQQTLLDLSYDYQRGTSVGNQSGKTGHLSKIVNNLDNNKNREYEYDALGRLTKAKGGANNLWQQQYSYDRFGNRESVTASGVAADNTAIPRDGFPNLSYNITSNRITTAGFEYDVAGNQTRALSEDGQTWLRYEYDYANRLEMIKKDDGTPLQAYQFSPSGSRLMNYDYISNEFILYANEGGTTLAEYREYTGNVPTWTKSYTYLGDSMLSTISNINGSENIEYNHPDRLGTRTVTNQQTGTSYEQTALPFGTALNAESSITNNKKRFTSYDRSERTGLDYAVNRSYDSKQGRFTQVDPIGITASSAINPQTLNLYSYCGNDPINHTDPDGLFFGSLFKWIGKHWKAILIVVAIVVAVILVTPGAWGLIKSFIAEVGLKAGIVSKGFTAVDTLGYSITGFGKALLGIGGVGAITNFAQTKKNNKFPCPPNAQKIYNIFANVFKDLLKNQSGHRTNDPLENGGWIYQRTDGSLVFEKVQRSARRADTIIGLERPPSRKGLRAVGAVHTHPYSNKVQDDALREKRGGTGFGTGAHGKDENVANAMGIPNLIVYEDYDGSHPANIKMDTILGSMISIASVGPDKLEQKNCK